MPVYVKNRLKGDNKGVAMLKADYTEAYSKAPTLLEATKVYQRTIKSILNNSSRLIDDTTMAMRLEEITALPIKERVQVLKQIAEIHKILAPTIKIKEEELNNGDIKRTKWSSIGGN